MRQLLFHFRYLRFSLLFTFVLFFLELWIWVPVFREERLFEVGVFYHLILMIIAGVIVYYRYRERQSVRFMVISFLFIATMGFFGGALALLLIVLYGLYSGLIDPIHSLIKMLMPELKLTKTEELYDRIIYGMESYDLHVTPIPINEIMSYGTPGQKIAAIEKMLTYFQPEFVEFLKMGVSDPSNSVRVMAATAISTLEDQFHRDYLRLDREYEHHKEDPKSVLQLAKLAEAYSQATFFDAKRTEAMKEISIQKYREYLELEPEDHESRLELATLLAQDKNFEGAKELIRPLPMTESVYFLMMDILFAQHKYNEMRKYTLDHIQELVALKEHGGSLDLEEAMMMWGGEGAARAMMEALSA